MGAKGHIGEHMGPDNILDLSQTTCCIFLAVGGIVTRLLPKKGREKCRRSRKKNHIHTILVHVYFYYESANRM